MITGNAGPSSDYDFDGGAFEIYNSSYTTIVGNTIRNNENVLETGASPDGGALRGQRVHRQRGHRADGGQPARALDRHDPALRHARWCVDHNTFTGLDWWVYELSTADRFSTDVNGLALTGNTHRQTARVYRLAIDPVGAKLVVEANRFPRTGRVVRQLRRRHQQPHARRVAAAHRPGSGQPSGLTRRAAAYAGRVSIPDLAALRALGPAQQPSYPDRDAVDAVSGRLRSLPPLVFAGECDELRDKLSAVARGEAFLLQGGDCAETFAGVTADNTRNKLRVLLQMAVVLTYAASVPVVKLGRLAGQYAKPRVVRRWRPARASRCRPTAATPSTASTSPPRRGCPTRPGCSTSTAPRPRR